MKMTKKQVHEHILNEKGCAPIDCDKCFYVKEYKCELCYNISKQKWKEISKRSEQITDTEIYEYILNMEKIEKLKEILK